MILDTNVVSELWSPRGSDLVRARVLRAAPHVRLSAIVVGELRRGISRLDPGRRRGELQSAYRELVTRHAGRILPVDLAVAEAWGLLSARLAALGRPLALADGLIAATALVHDLPVWTRNTRDFADTGARLFDPWEP